MKSEVFSDPKLLTPYSLHLTPNCEPQSAPRFLSFVAGTLTLRLVELLLLAQAVEVELHLVLAVLVLEKIHLLLALQFSDLLLLARLVLLALDLIDLQFILQPFNLLLVLELIQLLLGLLGLWLLRPRRIGLLLL